MTTSSIGRIAVSAALLCGLSGCGDSGVDAVKLWMGEVKRQTRVSIQKIAEPKKFIPFSYSRKDEIDPYNPIKLSVALASCRRNRATV